MGIWKRTRVSLGFSKPDLWRQPPMFRLRLAKDYLPRLAFGVGIGLAVNGPLLGIMLASAPPSEVGKALLLGLATVAVFSVLGFIWRDAVVVTVALEDAGIRRRSKPLLVNHFGVRNREDFWDYRGIAACGIVPASALQTSYSVLVIGSQLHLIAMGIPNDVDVQEVAARLSSRGMKVQMLQRLPAQARPANSVSRKGYVTAAILGGIGVLLVCIGGAARSAIHRARARVDLADVDRVVQSVKSGTALREFAVPGDNGVTRARISPDGRWVWGLTAAAKKHLIWNDGQDAPAGELAIKSPGQADATFTSDSRRKIGRASCRERV